jgi:DNA-directed RNA polymerase delta subunit
MPGSYRGESRREAHMARLSFLEAAYQILNRERTPLSAEDLTKIAIREQLVFSQGRTPGRTMGAQIYADIKRRGESSRFVKVGKAKFGLAQWEGVGTTGANLRPGTFRYAAYHVLKSANRPLKGGQITEIAARQGLLKTAGKTPEATMAAQLYVDVKKGESCPFVQLGKNRFGLREWSLDVIKDEVEKADREKGAPKAGRRGSIVGDPINFEGLIYGPLNENGVIFLFSKVHHKLGINLEAIQPAYPDAKGRRKTAKGWEDVWIEFEYKSSHFKQHKHDPDVCDVIVCWEHDWKGCPPELEVIELRKLIAELGDT